MSENITKPRRQRPKSVGKWPQWLCNPRLLRWTIGIGVWTYRLWRFWRTLYGMFGS